MGELAKAKSSSYRGCDAKRAGLQCVSPNPSQNQALGHMGSRSVSSRQQEDQARPVLSTTEQFTHTIVHTSTHTRVTPRHKSPVHSH